MAIFNKIISGGPLKTPKREKEGEPRLAFADFIFSVVFDIFFTISLFVMGSKVVGLFLSCQYHLSYHIPDKT